MDPLNLVFSTHGLRFSGDTLEKRSLGGSETAFAQLTKAFAKRGHLVTVFNECDNPGTFDGVRYVPFEAIKELYPQLRPDVHVACRWPEDLALPIEASLRVLWVHDTLVDKARIVSNLWQADAVFALSDFHIKNYVEQEKFLANMMWKTSNAIDPELIDFPGSKFIQRIPGRLLFTSRPERGLIAALNLLPQLIAKYPHVTLAFANYDLQGMQLPPEVAQAIEMANQMAAQFPNHVIKLGHLTKEQLYREMRRSEVLIYPTAFPEISCISMMEAQACGLPVVTTADFALMETVGPDCGHLIQGLPNDPNYQRDFLNAVGTLLTDKAVWAKCSAAGPKWIEEKGYTWDAVAASWEAKFEAMWAKRAENQHSIAMEAARQNSLVVAKELGYGLAWNASREVTPLRRPAAYARALELLGHTKRHSATFYEPHASTFPVGPGIAKAFPAAQITLWSVTPGLLAPVISACETGKLTNITATYEEPRDTYDVVVIGDWIQYLHDPDSEIRRLKQFVKPGGVFLFITDYGTGQFKCPIFELDSPRLWNLDIHDYMRFFTGQTGVLTSFVSDGHSASGDIIGTWVVFADASEINEESLLSIAKKNALRRLHPYQSIAACMIVKNEEDHLNRCLKAIEPIVDVIRITDTGSTDDTVKIAEKYGAFVKKVEFEDFGQVRNASIADTGADWIFWLDADEVLVGGNQIRKYLNSPLFNGLIIRQHHLMLDVHGTFDSPVRVFRNLPHFKFIGCVHEHAEDRSDPAVFDEPIQPSIAVVDANLAHYGYLNEQMRRRKCSNRNMRLLIKDLEVNPRRMLNKILAIRDLLNIAKWRLEKERMTYGSEPHIMLTAAVATYLKHLADSGHKFHDLGFPMYQEALSLLGRAGLPFEDRKTPPINIGFALGGSIGPMQSTDIKSASMWFIDDNQLRQYILNQAAQLATKSGAGTEWKWKKELRECHRVPFKTDVQLSELLAKGANVFQKDT